MAKTVVLIDPRPMMVLGVREALKGSSFEVIGSFISLAEARGYLQRNSPDVVLIHVSYANFTDGWCNMVVWGPNISHWKARRLLNVPVYGVLNESADNKLLLQCLRAVAGGNWFLDPRIGPLPISKTSGVAALTVRERAVYSHLLEGSSNKDIARQLRITVGTVKVFNHKIFVKLLVRDRKELIAKFAKTT